MGRREYSEGEISYLKHLHLFSVVPTGLENGVIQVPAMNCRAIFILSLRDKKSFLLRKQFICPAVFFQERTDLKGRGGAYP